MNREDLMDTPPPAPSTIRLEYNSIPPRRGRFYPRGRPRLAAGIGLAGLLWALALQLTGPSDATDVLGMVGFMATGFLLLVLTFIPLGKPTSWRNVLLTVGIYIASGVLGMLLLGSQIGVRVGLWWSEDKLAAEAQRVLALPTATTRPSYPLDNPGGRFGLVEVEASMEVDGAVFFASGGFIFTTNGLLYVPAGVPVPGPASSIYNARHLWGPWYVCNLGFD